VLCRGNDRYPDGRRRDAAPVAGGCPLPERGRPKGGAAIPDLAIVPEALFAEAQCRKNARGRTHPNQQRRLRHLLSGLLRCGACAAGMSTNGKDKSGRIRIRCSAANENGTCRDSKTFYLETVENAVLAGLHAEMRDPRVIAEYVRSYHEERKRLATQADAKRARLDRRLGELNRNRPARGRHRERPGQSGRIGSLFG
jgi:site-specific DNA recombinase